MSCDMYFTLATLALAADRLKPDFDRLPQSGKLRLVKVRARGGKQDIVAQRRRRTPTDQLPSDRLGQYRPDNGDLVLRRRRLRRKPTEQTIGHHVRFLFAEPIHVCASVP